MLDFIKQDCARWWVTEKYLCFRLKELTGTNTHVQQAPIQGATFHTYRINKVLWKQKRTIISIRVKIQDGGGGGGEVSAIHRKKQADTEEHESIF